MNHTRLWIAAAIIAFIVIVSFALSVPHTRDVPLTTTLQTESTNTPVVTLHDSFKKGVHTITGSIEAPNACTVLDAEAKLLNGASSTDGILIEISMPEDSGICLQIPTRLNFSTTISAPANIPITATVNGLIATTTDS